MRRLEDLEEIRQLFVDYGYLLDLGDYAAYAQLFAEDGELMLGPLGRAKGRQEIETMMARVGGAGSLHLITSPIVTLDGDRAVARVMWTVIQPGRGRDPVRGHGGPSRGRARARGRTLAIPASTGIRRDTEHRSPVTGPGARSFVSWEGEASRCAIGGGLR